MPRSPDRVRYAVVGLGYISQVAMLPAFAHASRNSELAALVSDDQQKLHELTRKYRVKQTYSYDELGPRLREDGIDAVYIAVPNHLHQEFTLRAAEAGLHVLCEKPMALSEAECVDMIGAAQQHGVKLMIAYRLHFEAGNLHAIEIAQSGKIGEPRIFESVFTMQVEDTENYRLDRAAGGGPLWDLGVYCVNAARYLFRAEPERVWAAAVNSGDPRFAQVEETASAVLTFSEGRVASFSVSFGAADVSSYRLVGTKGSIRMDPAYEMADDLVQYLTVNGKPKTKTFPKRDQFAPELVYFSDCIRQDRDPEPSGREGLADVRVIRAIHESIATGQAITLPNMGRLARPNKAQEIRRPPVSPPRLVKARGPSDS